MDLGRQDIERTDFASVRRGYDPAEVDAHLRAIADSVEQALQEANRDNTAAGAASRGVKKILETAEKLAADLETESRKEGERIETAARLEGEKIVEKAQSAAAAEEKRAQRANERLKRANGELTRLREALAGLSPVAADETAEVEAVPEPTEADAEPETKEHKAATAHAEPTNGDGAAAEETQESPAEAAHEAAPEGEATPEGDPQDGEGARLIALNMALTGTPREETARYLQENFELEDPESILDDAYSRAG